MGRGGDKFIAWKGFSLPGPALNLPEGLLPIIFGSFYDSACFSVSL